METEQGFDACPVILLRVELCLVAVAILEVEIGRAIQAQDTPTDFRVDWLGSVCEQRPPKQDRPVRVAGLVQDVPWTELAHPVVGLKVPARSRI